MPTQSYRSLYIMHRSILIASNLREEMLMKLVWVSDVHLNFLSPDQRFEFYGRVKEAEGDQVIISGDIAESQNVVSILEEMQAAVGIPVNFVLGNHDYYCCSNVANVKKSVKHLNWLPQAPVELTRDTIMIGVDGWGDCRNGDYENSNIIMNDWVYIKDLKRAYLQGMDKLKVALQELADKDARSLKRQVNAALKKGIYSKIIIVSHVPAFEEASMYAGRKSTPSGLPFYSSKCLGDAILPLAKSHPHIDFLWLSGHTHNRAKYKPCNNMTVKVAKAEYFYPQVEQVFDI